MKGKIIFHEGIRFNLGHSYSFPGCNKGWLWDISLEILFLENMEQRWRNEKGYMWFYGIFRIMRTTFESRPNSSRTGARKGFTRKSMTRQLTKPKDCFTSRRECSNVYVGKGFPCSSGFPTQTLSSFIPEIPWQILSQLPGGWMEQFKIEKNENQESIGQLLFCYQV